MLKGQNLRNMDFSSRDSAGFHHVQFMRNPHHNTPTCLFSNYSLAAVVQADMYNMRDVDASESSKLLAWFLRNESVVCKQFFNKVIGSRPRKPFQCLARQISQGSKPNPTHTVSSYLFDTRQRACDCKRLALSIRVCKSSDHSLES